jgi:hypothetical protein
LTAGQLKEEKERNRDQRDSRQQNMKILKFKQKITKEKLYEFYRILANITIVSITPIGV